MSEEFEYGFCSGSWWNPPINISTTATLADVGVFNETEVKAATRSFEDRVSVSCSSMVYQRTQESDSTLEFILPTCWNQVLNGQADWSPENYSDSDEVLRNFSKGLPLNSAMMMKSSSPKHQPHNQLHLSNNTSFWNTTADVPSQFLTSTFKENAFKRPRIETLSPLPTFKVRKEKLGDRITALQQLVSPFGKTDTASVLSEAVEYIKFLHEQLGVLSTPRMKSGGLTHYQEKSDKSKDSGRLKKDLSSRGLCLVPISSTLSITNETTADLWTPRFAGSYRDEE
ncbi:hypothetical protein ACHQM5_025650 [Ranunculus cassubicifolius]